MTILEWTLQWTVLGFLADTSTSSLFGMTVSSSPSGLNGLLLPALLRDANQAIHLEYKIKLLSKIRRIQTFSVKLQCLR